MKRNPPIEPSHNSVNEGVIEEIAVEGDSAPSVRGPRLELWLGLVLAVAVLSFATVDWLKQEGDARAYSAASWAAERRDWDAAHSMFAALGDYRDSAKQSEKAAQLITDRNAAYAAGIEADGRGDWLTAAGAFSNTVAIQPSYLDAALRYDDARSRVVDGSLVNIIYRRAEGAGQGLFVRLPGPVEIHLPQSDRFSRVWASDPANGRVVYDAEWWDPEGSTTPASTSLSTPRERHLMAATISGSSVEITQLPEGLSPGLIVPGHNGLWAQTALRSNSLPPEVKGYAGFELTYVDLQTGDSSPAVLPGDNWAVLAIDPGGRLLLGEFVGLGPSGVQSTRLYLSDADGSNPHPFYLAGGFVRAAEFSPDGDYILYTTFKEHDQGPNVSLASLDLVSLRGSKISMQTLGAVIVPIGSAGVPIAAEFLPGLDQFGLLIKLSNGHSDTIRARTIDAKWQMQLWSGPTLWPERYWVMPGGPAVVFSERAPGGYRFTLIPIDKTSSVKPVQLPAFRSLDTQPKIDVTLSGQYVVYTVAHLAGWDAPGALEVYATRRDMPAATSTPVFQDTVSGLPDSANFLILPDGLLTYVAPEQGLRLCGLDGLVDLPGITGVDMILPYGLPQTTIWEPSY